MQQKPIISPKKLKMLRITSVITLILAIGYVVMPYDFDKMGLLGYVDDFFVFMAAFTFFNGSMQKAERQFIRKQLYMISLVFVMMALVWLFVLMVMKMKGM